MTTEDKGVNSGGAVPEELLHTNKKDEEEEQEQQELVPYLDEDIITKILIKLDSAESLFNNLRYVCKLWSNIILHHPDIHLNNLLPSSKPPCLIIQHHDHSSLRYLNTKTEEEVVSAIYTNPRYTTCSVKLALIEEGVLVEQQVDDLTPPFNKLLIRACANGKMLASPYGSGNFQTLYVVDPRTNHRLALPPCPVITDIHSTVVGFIFLPHTQKYKVVTIGNQLRGDNNPYVSFQILTLSYANDFCGSSFSSSSSNDDDLGRMWKLIELPEQIMDTPLAINGFFYWSRISRGTQYITSFDVAAEIFCTTPHPLYHRVEWDTDISGFLDIGGYLAYWWLHPEDEGENSWTLNVHVMEDLHKAGAEWKELYGGVTMDPGFTGAFGSNPPRPVLSVGNGQVIIFRTFGAVGGPLLAYNFKSHKWWPLGIDLKQPEDVARFMGFHVHNTVPFHTLYRLKQK